MEDISKLVQNYASTFEQCLLSKDPVGHVRSLPESKQKNLLLFLLEPHSSEYKQTLRTKYSIKGSLLQTIDNWKMQAKVASASNPQEIKYIIDKIGGVDSGAFNYPKPADFHTTAQQGKSQESLLPNKLKPIKPLRQWVEQQLKKNQDIFSSLSREAVKSLGQEQLKKLKPANKQQFLNQTYIREYSDKFAVQFIKSFYEQMQKTNKSFEIPGHIFYNLSKSQFLKLREAIPNLINKDQYLRVWFSSNYNEELQLFSKEDLSISQKDQKRKVLLKILKDLDHLKTSKTKSMKRNITKQLLLLDISREDVDKNIFLQYVRDNPISSSYEKQKFREQKQNYKSKSSYEDQIDLYIPTNTSNSPAGEDDIIKQSIERLFKRSDAEKILTELQEFFETSKLNKIYATCKLADGGKVEEFQNYLTMEEIKQLKETREITIIQKNRRKWKADDQIELKVRVKNIENIHVQIYKIDLQKHFNEGNSDIDSTQNLSYMHPNHSYYYRPDNSNPYRVQTYDIKIEGIPEGRGVWIVELEGEGISSRAFIRKGAIVNVNKSNTTGTQLKFYDQTGSRITDFTIWMQGKKHQAKQSFVIPFGQSDKNLNLTVIKDGFAQSFNVYVPRESYYIDISYIYNSESFIVGSIAKVLLHPSLRLSSNPEVNVSFKLLQKVKILVTLTNNLGIKSTIDFDNVQFKATQDYILQFPIQSYISQINIQVTAKVKKYNKTQQNLSSSHSVNINLSEGNSNFLDIYMRRRKDGYNLFLLGKNGQPVPRTQLSVQLSIQGRTNQESQNLMTSKDGSVNLGQLENVTKVTARVNSKSGSVVREWSFSQKNREIAYISSTIYQQGDQITILTRGKQKIELWKTLSNGVYAENLSKMVKAQDYKLVIKEIKAGRYALKLLDSDKIIQFTVIKGKIWQNENKIYDQKNGILYEITPELNNNFVFGQATFKKQQGNVLVEIPIITSYDIKNDSSFRAHLMASSFVSPNFNNKFDVSTVRSCGIVNVQTFSVKQSEYFNNKKLSEESSYVINRGKQKKYIGNNLQKPRIFLKRLEVRNTTQLQQVLEDQGAYSCNLIGGGGGDRFRAQKCYDRQQKAYGGFGAYGDIARLQPYVNPLDLTTHNNFISLPATIVSNQKGDKIQFKIPEGYSHYECLAFSKNNAISRKYDLPVEQMQIKDLSHTGIKSSGKETAWTMSREVYKLQKGQNIKVGRDSVWTPVGITNIIGFSKIKGATVQDWVINWNTYNQEEKLKIYDQKICHELNTYIKYNDNNFFDKIVKPFIENKVTKTFVDLCLLDNQDCLKWTDLQKLQQLNQFEKVLLVHALVKKGRKEDAQSIASAMEGVNKSQRISFEQFKNEFDTVITAKLTEQAKIMAQLQSRGPDRSTKMSKKKMKVQSTKQRYMQKSSKQCAQIDMDYDDDSFQDRNRVIQPFKQMQKTKEYTQTTYSGMKYPHQSKNLIKASPFWTSAAQHFINGSGQFLSENFMYLTTAVQFTLASCFIPNQKLLDYGLRSQGEHVAVQASSSFLIFVREVKSLPFEKKFGVLLNQRFFNPDDRYTYQEDGTRIQKESQQFIVRKPYCIQTLITNTSGTRLELQLLIDIPQGSMPLQSHQTTRIQSIYLQPYSTLSFQRHFYFPRVGSYNLYPANACRGGLVIAKAEQIPKIEVLQNETIKKMDTLQNVLKSGDKESILQYLQNKNIFDSKIFEPSNFLWMLKDKEFYYKVVNVLRSRKFFVSQIWMFGLLHQDLKTITELISSQNVQTPDKILTILPIFEYFPYYSSRAHKFLNQNKSTIRNKQFKTTYYCYLFASLFSKPTSPRSRVVFIYYLLLQDRIDEAHSVLSLLSDVQKQQHQLQFDYIECFIDMYKGYPTFAKARKLALKYVDYPVATWQKMFKQIVNTLKEYDSQEVTQQKKKVEYSTNVINEGNQLRISIPADTLVQVCIYDINLELYFSNFPFSQVQGFCSNIIPNSIQVFNPGQSREQKFLRSNSMKDCFIEVLSSISGLNKKKVSSFLWSNPNIKIKVKEEKGFAQVFCEGKRQPGCYCKVYQMKNGQSKFYRDGYTDITGTFKYALADLEGVTQFAILFVTDIGGVVERVKPPSQQAYLS